MAKLSSIVKEKKKKTEEQKAKQKKIIVYSVAGFTGVVLLLGAFIGGRMTAPQQSSVYVADKVQTAPFQQAVDSSKDGQIKALTSSLNSLSDSTGISKFLNQVFSTGSGDKIFEEDNTKLASKYTFLTSITETNTKLGADWTNAFKSLVNLTDKSELDKVQTELANVTTVPDLVSNYVNTGFPKQNKEDQSDYGVVGNVVAFPVSDLSETVIKMKKTDNTTDAKVESVGKQGDITYYVFVPVTKAEKQSVLIYNVTAQPFSEISKNTNVGQMSAVQYVGELSNTDLSNLFKKNDETKKENKEQESSEPKKAEQ